MLLPGNARTFFDYADPPSRKFGSYVMNQMKHANRVDVVWDNVTAIETDKQIINTYHEKSCASNQKMCWVLLHVHRKRQIQK